ncbi:ribonucleoside-diphosphate reductase large chain [Gigaspora margarita]|uniref:Ribonucleoside-diphosphate reductase large chain n=1 Tax=Gigaspora margarita TaxID=4874 RepID=A0A8H3X6L2_GIGMA|nr:ribonucleoside-diphosphate reductase large chain [Gigaspora margarita]
MRKKNLKRKSYKHIYSNLGFRQKKTVMSNQNNPGGSRNGFQQAGGSRQQNERLNPIEEVMDAFKNIALTAGSGAILAPNWQSASLVDSGQEPLKGPGNERNQIPIDRSKGSSGESKNKGVATENGGWDKNHRVDPFDEERNNQAHKNYYSNFGNSYMDLGDATDPTTGNHNFGCQTIGSRPFEGTRTPPPPPQQREQRSDSKNEQNSNFRHEQTSDSKHDQGSTMSQSLNIQSHTSQSQTESVHDHQPIVLSTDSITFKINAWHSIADPNAAERDDGIGTGQLHRKGRNYRPVDEATVLAIQQKGKSSTKKPKKLFEDNSTPLPSSSNNKPIQKSLSRSKPLSKPGPHKLPNNPFATNTFTSPSSSTSPASSAPQRPYPVKQDARTTINQQQQREKTSSPLPPPLQQQPQSSQTPSQGPEKENWTSPNLVTTPFWEIPQNNNSQSAAKSTHYQQSQSYRHPSPARSPRPSKYSQDFLPYIPPEFDSTPYRKQSSPSPARGYSPARGHSPARSYSNGYIDEPPEYERESNFDDQEDYDQNSDVDDETNVYYEEDESFSEKEGYESASVLFDDEPISRPLPPPLVPTPVSPKHDRGHHLLTINVELSESEPPQAIVVYVNDDPAVLAREFCNKWKVTNDVVEPALVQLIREEREKRLG